jgi:hypothetical protein
MKYSEPTTVTVLVVNSLSGGHSLEKAKSVIFRTTSFGSAPPTALYFTNMLELFKFLERADKSIVIFRLTY